MRRISVPDISVNDVAIPSAVIAREAQNHRSTSAEAAWREAARALVVRELLLQRAHFLDLAAEPRTQDGARETEDEALTRALLDQEVRVPTADEATCRRYYDKNRKRFRAPDLFEPAHILFKARRDDATAYARAVELAETALAEVQAHPERFDELARSLSDCPSASDGGRLGQVVRGEMTPEFESALLALEPGQTCATPLRTRYGVHVVRLDRKIAGEVLPFERVRDRVARYLEGSAWRRAVAQYISLLAGQARIEGLELPAAASPLVQ